MVEENNKIKIPANENTNFSLLLQKLAAQLTEIQNTVNEIRKYNFEITVSVDE